VIMLFLIISPIVSGAAYIALLFVVCVSAVYLIFKAKALKKKSWIWTMLCIAILYNPLLPIRLSQVDAALVNTIAACIFITSLLKVRDEEETRNLNMPLIKIAIGILFLAIIIFVSLYCYFLKRGYFS
jgi:hypothetical protein